MEARMRKFLISTVALLMVCVTVEAGPLARLFGRGQPSRTYQPQQTQVVQTQASSAVCENGQCQVVQQTPAAWAAYPYQSPPAYQTVRYVQQAQPVSYSQPAQFSTMFNGAACTTGR